ncbi:MAG: hydantoinase B/oxoprolinase family protein [Candidatus Aminicenantes bacterium]|nr:hydantoinase B/oxoprolinase family protein [Candidatus Aminicenantes bacterium]
MDPITAEIISSVFRSIVEEMGFALIRSAYSTNIKERRDCSCAVFDPDGGLIALAEHIPIHLGSMQGLMCHVLKKKPDLLFEEGDVLAANDPFHGGGSHLPDVTLIKPVFYKGRLAAFVADIAHWSDVGGQSPGGGTAGSSREIYQEGLRIPPTFVIKKGKLREDVFEILLLNMRNREEREGDFRAQTASLELGEKRVKSLFQRHGFSLVYRGIQEEYDYSERMLRNSLREIPEGTFAFSDVMDDDGVGKKPLRIRVAVTIRHGSKPSIHFDFRGTDLQSSGGINMVYSALMATVLYTVKVLAAPEVFLNQGFARPIYIHAEKGSLVNAVEPAAVGGRTDTCQRVVDAVLGAMFRVIPEKVVAASNGATTAVIFGGTKDISGYDFVYVEALGGGMGARYGKDGADGVQVHITNTSNLPIESMEMEYPLRVLRYGLIPDSGGPGKFRGGMAIRKDILALKPLLFSSHSDRHVFVPWGFKGGKPGEKGFFHIFLQGRFKKKIPSKINGYLIKKGDVLSAGTAGGGGFGNPLERDEDKVIRDVIQGRVSRQKAHAEYGIVIRKNGKIDRTATKKERAQKRAGKN